MIHLVHACMSIAGFVLLAGVIINAITATGR